MALKYAVKSGDWSGTDVWGIQLTGTVSFTNGSTLVTGVGTLFLTELAVGDYIFGDDGVWYQVASITDDLNLDLAVVYGGVSVTGVTTYKQTSAPIEGDNAVINSGVTVSLDNELGVVTVGDDTGDALTIYGTLQYTSASLNDVTLRLKGNGKNYGTVQIGSTLNPIENTVFTLELNYSAALGDEKYNFYNYDGSSFIAQGKSITQQTTLQSGILAGDTTFVATDITGWEVGDYILVDYVGTGWVYSGYRDEKRQITAIDPATNTITVDSAFSYDHDTQCYVYNISRKIIIKAYNSSYRAKFRLEGSSSCDIDFLETSGLGDDSYFSGVGTNYYYGGFYIGGDNNKNVDNIVIYKGEYRQIGIHTTGTFSNIFLISATMSLSPAGGVTINNLYLLSDGYPGSSFYNVNPIGNTFNNIRTTANSGGIGWCLPQYVNGLFITQACVNSWSGAKNVARADWGLDYKWTDITIKNSQDGIYITGGANVSISGSVSISASEPIRITSGMLNSSNISLLDVIFDSKYQYNPYDYGYVYDVSGIVIAPYGKYGKSSAWSVVGRGGIGECFVIDPSSSSDYIYPKNSYYDWFFTQFPVNSAKSITLSFYVKVSTTGFDGVLEISAEECGIDYSWTVVDLTGADVDWVQRSFLLGTTTDKGFVRLKIRAKDGATVSGDIYLDDFAITEA